MSIPQYFCYLRKSTDVDDKQTLSIEAQEREVIALAKRRGLHVVGDPFREAKSAKRPGREQFTRMLEAIHQGKANAIVCWSLDRLARNPLDGGQLMWSLSEGLLREIVTPERVYTGTGEDKLLMSIIFGMATKYSDDLSNNVKRGNRERLERGLWPTAPKVGYERDHATGQLVRDPERFPIVQELWRMRLRGMSVEQIAQYAVNDAKLTTPRFKSKGGALVSRSWVYRFFHDSFYAGLMRHGGQTYRGGHEPVVTWAEFEHAQEMFDNNRGLLTHRDEEGKRLFFTYGGLLRCGNCSARVTAENTTNRHGKTYCYYHCGRKSRAFGYCAERSIEERRLDEACEQFLTSLSIPDNVSTWLLEQVAKLEQNQSTAREEAVHRLSLELERAAERIERLWALGLDGGLDPKEFARRREQLQGEQRHIEQEIARLEQGSLNLIEPVKGHVNLMKQALVVFQNGDRQEKRAIMEAVSSNLVLKDRTVQILAKPVYQHLSSVRPDVGWFTRWDDLRTLLMVGTES